VEITSTGLVSAIEELVRKGYKHKFRLRDARLVDAMTGAELAAGQFRVDAAYRFETSPGSDDCSILYAISATDDAAKGLLVDAFHLYQLETNASVGDFDVPPFALTPDHSDDPSMKYGVRKITKADFNDDPDRYVLRKGFPDFPDCPFDQAFSMLGFDLREQNYVWLVTGILKDERLVVETYENSTQVSPD
jgi:hypothetical protein